MCLSGGHCPSPTGVSVRWSLSITYRYVCQVVTVHHLPVCLSGGHCPSPTGVSVRWSVSITYRCVCQVVTVQHLPVIQRARGCGAESSGPQSPGSWNDDSTRTASWRQTPCWTPGSVLRDSWTLPGQGGHQR